MTRVKRKKRHFKKEYQAIILLIIIFLTWIVVQELSEKVEVNETTSSKKAIILDVLSLDFPNNTFIRKVKNILSSSNFTVDIYRSKEVSLDFFNKLPSKDYDLIIFRTHGGRIKQPIGLFIGTGLFIQPCSKEDYRVELESGYLLIGRPTFSANKLYCVIPPHYITDKLEGSFKQAIIIVMACYTAEDDVLARAFFRKGAYAYIGFSGKVTPNYVDAFVTEFLEQLYVKKLSVSIAFEKTVEMLGDDPYYGGQPKLYLAS